MVNSAVEGDPYKIEVGSSNLSPSTSYAPFVYRLGHPPFTQVRGVRFPYGVPDAQRRSTLWQDGLSMLATKPIKLRLELCFEAEHGNNFRCQSVHDQMYPLNSDLQQDPSTKL